MFHLAFASDIKLHFTIYSKICERNTGVEKPAVYYHVGLITFNSHLYVCSVVFLCYTCLCVVYSESTLVLEVDQLFLAVRI